MSEEEGFKRLVTIVAKMRPQTWCARERKLILTVQTIAARCWECPEFVLNKGVCDPL